MPDSSELEKAVEANAPRASVHEADATPSESGTEPSSQVSDPKSDWIDKQSNVLPHRKLMIIFPVIALVQFTSYLDQSTISTAVPSIGADLNLGINVSWVASSFLISSTCTQLVNGRLSDIFGRKELLLTSLAFLGIGNLCAGFSQNGAMLFAFRALSGLGGGAINVVVMIIASDITTLQQRGKYNGFIGAAVVLGNGLGPLVGGALTTHVGWRWAIWYDVPWIAFIITLAALILPKSKTTGNVVPKLKLVDWLGVALVAAAVLLILIPLSQGGTAFPWDSALVITMLLVGGAVAVVFLLVEWKVARLPVVPLRLFHTDLSANIILTQATLFGFVFWSNLYYIPLYLQNVLGYSPIISGALIIPMVATQGIGSIVGGRLISRTGHYNPVIITSQFLWLIGVCLQILYGRQTRIWEIVVFGFLQGIGVGGAFQPSLVALLAHSLKKDRAVINSLRNFVRTIGGSVGLTVSGAILNNVLRSSLTGVLPDATIALLAASTSELKTLSLSPAEHEMVLNAYMKGIHVIFITYAPIIGICFLLSLLVKDDGLAERDHPSRLKEAQEEQTAVDNDSERGTQSTEGRPQETETKC